MIAARAQSTPATGASPKVRTLLTVETANRAKAIPSNKGFGLTEFLRQVNHPLPSINLVVRLRC